MFDVTNVWLSTPSQRETLVSQPDAYQAPDSGIHPITVEVDERSVFQSIDGFGAALTDASAWLIEERMDWRLTTGLLRILFDPADGLGLSIVRLPMGASEFYTGTAYTYDDNGGTPDPDLTNFSIAHDEQYIIPILQQIKTINPAVKIIAAPWSAPAWMKDSGRLEGGKLKPEYYAVYADYFLRFVQAYAAHGLPIYAVSLQNEPEHESTTYPTMLFPADDAARFVADYLGPLFEANDIQTQIWIWDHNWDNPEYPLSVLSNPAARGYIQATAFHAYTGTAASQTTVHDAWPHKDIQFTEQSGGEWDTDFGSNLKWGVQNLLIGATRNWAKSVLRWNIALNTENGPHQGGCNNCLGLVTIDESARNFTYENDYYLLGHLSRFVRPGAVRIASSHFPGIIESVAFKNPDGSKVLLVLNPATAETDFKVRYNGKSFVYRLAGGAVVTFVWQGDDLPVPLSNLAGVVRDGQGQPITGVTVG